MNTFDMPRLICCPSVSRHSLSHNAVGVEGTKAIAAVLKNTQISELKCGPHHVPSV